MAKRGGNRPRNNTNRALPINKDVSTASQRDEPIEIPLTNQALFNIIEKAGNFNPFPLRLATLKKIEDITQRPLICYVTKTSNISPEAPVSIEHSDLTGFYDLIKTTEGPNVDILIVSNGGIAEATERIVKLIRNHYENIRFIVPSNAYSAATLLSLSGNEIIMTKLGTLGPIDPQIRGIPARAIERAFENIKDRITKEGPVSLTAYLPLLQKYDLHLLEMCRSARELSEELAKAWLSEYMLKCDINDSKITTIVDSLNSFDENKSHSRGIDLKKARELGLIVTNAEDYGIEDYLISLLNQFNIMFERTPYVKLFENSRGINWGRNYTQLLIEQPPSRPK